VSSAADRVLSALRHDILSGALAPGWRLTEASLCARYDVSRVPVREALRALAADGLVDVRPHAGATVAVISADEADDLYAVRATIEEITLRRCALRVREAPAAVSAGLEHLREVVATGLAAVELRRTEELPALNTRFHLGVAELSGSTSMLALLRQVADRIQWIYSTNVSAQGWRSWVEHRGMVDAIAAGDEERAGVLARQHITNSRTGFLAAHAAATS
jgi:DNA-binding GntR family transcriptional regulator